MVEPGNQTQASGSPIAPTSPNCPNTLEGDWLKTQANLIVYVLSTVLVLSLLLNLFWCLSKVCSGKGRYQCRKKQSRNSRQMEDNPIYGNLSYMDASVGVYTDAATLHPSLSSSSLRNPQRVNPDSQSKNQECYANLTLKAPRPQSGRISPKIQLAVMGHSEEPEEAETEDPVNTDDAVSTMSDLYASVQTQRAKLVDAVDGEDYANHL
ncbi:hypothetical protein CHARACLAT_002094 [Characodon lateralis]|uniref:Uncharacterized protein n=1 Tax=Characodon lateralis TaxID=208331 RepID=A0ABU7CU18_9TELE|nr:hypothetical protein [Characodon lateralis]